MRIYKVIAQKYEIKDNSWEFENSYYSDEHTLVEAVMWGKQFCRENNLKAFKVEMYESHDEYMHEAPMDVYMYLLCIDGVFHGVEVF